MYRRKALTRGVLALGLAAPVLGFAASDETIIEQIIVTAQKRASALQDVPFSVAASSEQQIRDSGSTNIVDLARNFAGLTIADLGPGQSQVAIRGISAGQVIRDQPGVKEQVGIYLDESPISIALFTPDLELFDIERFEVLRGPQGTLFGAGSLSGTLRYITQQPKIGVFEGAAEVSALQGSDTDFGGAVKGAVNLPLGDTAAMRVVAYYDKLPGFIDSRRLDGSVDEDLDSGNKTGARVALTFQPNENVTITPRIVYQKLDTDGFPRIDAFNILANPFTTTQPAVRLGEREQYVQLEEGIEDDFTLADLRMEFALGGVTLTSITSYTDREVVVTRDATTLTGSVSFDISFPDIVRLSSALVDTTDLQAISEELRLSGDDGSALQWLVGAFYQDVDRDYSQFLPTPGWDAATGIDNAALNAVADSPFFSGLDYSFKQFALFGEATYRLSEQWSLTGGLRYYDFDEDRILNFGGAFADVTVDLPGSTSSDGFSPRAILAYEVNDDVLLTAQVARGFRLGGINDPINIPLCSPQDIQVFGNQSTWDDEKNTNYELGAKMQFADRRVTLNAAVFYSDIDDLQATTDAGTCSSRIVFNVPKARSVGVEAELFARPSDNWDFGIAATWVNAELRSTVTSTSGGNTIVVGGLESGKQLPTAPEFQAVASIGYTVPFRGALDAFGNLTVQHVGSSFSQFADNTANFGVITTAANQPNLPGSARLIPFGAPNITTFNFNPELPSYEIGNLRVGVRNDAWEAALFINNIWDERAFLALDRERGRSARVGYLTNMPRTFGVSLRMNF
jgi:iron complex outermembrane recepter protein